MLLRSRAEYEVGFVSSSSSPESSGARALDERESATDETSVLSIAWRRRMGTLWWRIKQQQRQVAQRSLEGEESPR